MLNKYTGAILVKCSKSIKISRYDFFGDVKFNPLNKLFLYFRSVLLVKRNYANKNKLFCKNGPYNLTMWNVGLR